MAMGFAHDVKPAGQASTYSKHLNPKGRDATNGRDAHTHNIKAGSLWR